MSEIDKIKELEEKIEYYEQNGAAKLFYALNRKMAEMADRLNATNIKTITLDDPKDKTFDRLKVIWNDASGIATAVKMLGETAGITRDEAKDTQMPKFRISPESMAQSIGDIKTQEA